MQTATAANTNGDYTTIESGSTDDQPNQVLMVTPVYNPGGAGGTYNDHAVGVYYDTDLFGGLWDIFNEDSATMPVGASFNVMVDAIGSGGGISTGQLATSANTSGNLTFINDPRMNGDPNAVVFDTPNLSPYLSTCGYINNPCASDLSATGLWWSAGWGEAAVFNEDQSPMPLNADFNLIIYQS